MGYTKNIKLKPISFLQAGALNYDIPITLGIEDKNGVFIGSFNEEHKLINDYSYINNNERKNKDIIIIKDKINIEKVYEYLKTQEPVSPHMLKPLYVKKLEVQNG